MAKLKHTKKYVQNPYRAFRQFSSDKGHLYRKVPLLAFEYYVRFNIDADALNELYDQSHGYAPGFYSRDATDLSPLLKNFTMPSVSVDTDIFNEYNRKRVSQTKLSFDPVKLTFHDTADGVTAGIWQAYYLYYFTDGGEKDQNGKTKGTEVPNEIINADGESSANSSFGYNINRVGKQRNLINSIEIFQVHAGSLTQCTLYNPRIVKFEHDTMSYEESRPLEVSYTMEYEYAVYRFGESLEDIEDADIQAFFNTGKPFDVLVGTLPKISRPGFLGSVLDGILGDGTSDFLNSTKESALGIIGTAREVAGRVQSISSLYSNIKSELPFGLGNKLPDNPLPSVRPFTEKLSTIRDGFIDVDRIISQFNLTAQNVTQPINSGEAPKPESSQMSAIDMERRSRNVKSRQ